MRVIFKQVYQSKRVQVEKANLLKHFSNNMNLKKVVVQVRMMMILIILQKEVKRKLRVIKPKLKKYSNKPNKKLKMKMRMS